MRFSVLLVLLVSLVFLSSSYAQDFEGEDVEIPIEGMLELFVDLKAEILALERRVVQLESQLATVTGSADLTSSFESMYPWDEDRDSNRAALREIEYPAYPTEASVRTYIDEIGRATRGQNTFSSDDPQVRMLTKVGPVFVPLLLEHSGHELDYYLVEAVNRLATEDHKAIILEELAYRHDLIEVVVVKGWTEDAYGTLIEELDADSGYLPEEWIEAVVSLNDPSTYDALTHFLIEGSNRASTFYHISSLPGIDLEKAVEEAWRTASTMGYERLGMAGVAVQYGYLDALEVLIDNLNNPEAEYYRMGSPRLLLRRHTRAGDSLSDIRGWYEQNKDRMLFDQQSKQFYVP